MSELKIFIFFLNRDLYVFQLVESTDREIGAEAKTSITSKRLLKGMDETIALRSTINKKFVTADDFGSRPLIASSNKVNE